MYCIGLDSNHCYSSDQDMSQQTPTQELIAKDLHGTEWHFKHIFRGDLLVFVL